jgi:pSer/pThr/pTyr-binding forkhead associated (FHA) protein
MATDSKTPKVPLTFRIFRGNDLVRTETLTQSPIKIGKLSSSHLRLEDDESVSRMHAVIEVTSAKDITIIDLGSTKGTIVNGKKINKASLQDGDIILLGDTKIVLSMEESMDEEPTQVSESPMKQAVAPAPLPASPPPVAAAPPPPVAPPPPKVGSQTGPAVIASSPAPAPSMPPPAGVRPMAPPPAMAAPPAARPAAPVVSGEAAAAQFSGGAQELGADLAGRRAIEVAAMLSDSVISVRHLTNPRGGKLSTTTIGLFAAGAIGCLLAVGIFFKGMSVAADNKALLHQWVEVDKQDPIDFRPIRLSPVMDILALFGVLGGLVALGIATARALDERRSPYFRIGNSREVEFPTADVPGGQETFTLVGPRGDDFVFHWAPGMKGEMVVEGTTTPIEQVAQGNVIPHKARIRVESGKSTFVISSVPAPRAAPVAFNFDSAFALFAAISFGFHALMVILFFLLLDDISGYASDELGDDLRGTRVQIKPQEDPKPPEEKNTGKDAAGQTGGTGTAMVGDSGKMGKKESDRKTGQFAIKKDGETQQLAKEQRLEAARSAGALGVLRAQQGGAFAHVTGTGDFSSGLDDRDVFGGLQGNEVGEMQGGFGYGVSGSGAGGGGTGLGTIGTGRYGTIGHGSGTGTGYGVKGGGGGLPGRQPSGPKVSIGNAQATGDLDKNTIRRYVRQKLAQIEYCYQKQLLVKPTLAGTVNTQFTIDGNGRVIAAKAGGMGNGDVEGCVADVIRSIQFPKPTGGGIVNVTSYPFTFRPAGN